MSRAKLSRAEFEQLVVEALESLPKRFADMVENVVISVEEEPSTEDLESLEDDDGAEDAEGDTASELLGIYRGVALPDRYGEVPLLPDEIAIFRGPINRVADTREDAMREIRETVIHELGHYFGLDHDDMPH